MDLQKYNFNSLYICGLLLLYNLWKTNDYITIIVNKLYLLDSTSVIIAINIIGWYLFLKNVSFEISVKCSFTNPFQ